MKKYFYYTSLLLLFVSCSKELSFETQTFTAKSSLPCTDDCPEIKITIPVAKGPDVMADSINTKTLNTIKEIVYFGEKPYNVSDYNGLTKAFIGSYDEMKKTYPDETLGWFAHIKADIEHQSDQIINIKVEHETYTGGAHGYHGFRSLLFDANTGKSIKMEDLFTDKNAFLKFAETAFRKKYKIPANQNINSTGLMFEKEQFQLPLNLFYTQQGLLLYYNSYEVASYADGPKEIVFPYESVKNYLKYL
ncbi:DUF3298 and DUF4163 domain-containing protein [Flavobacterium agrisoli]|uniref:DUF4163 domain-containing protein n=1 Tax=Flavobacterium agrisoli TaxID=2793066 RepID=A0A934PMH8_9FLAO|nr:DUF3298 and DUF4163 domain-containing protein [Flavobacterium agrisoli]MBK0369560.1 DUF4163 domain-containing protein [Flavobacterium agrisoli]